MIHSLPVIQLPDMGVDQIKRQDHHILSAAIHEYQAQLQMASDALQEKLGKLKHDPSSMVGLPDKLTPARLKTLHALANCDITIRELAKVRCISPITANQHIEAARKALGAKTNIHAIKIAILKEFIHYTPID